MKRLMSISVTVAAACFMMPAGAQERHASDDLEFVEYLIGNGMAEDAVLYLSKDMFHASDTLEYLRGWAGYSARMLEGASDHFSKVPSSSSFYDKSLFFNVISNTHLERYALSASLLDSYKGPFKELQSLERAGIALLQDMPDEYLKAAEGFTFSQYSMTESERQLQDIYSRRYESPRKSPFIAAAASTLVPGMGKIYAGELGEGLSSLLVTASMAAITAENWSRNGAANWKTLLFGSLTAAFYIGNIYGSYISVSIHNNDVRKAQDTAVLYHIHIPLRSCFD